MGGTEASSELNVDYGGGLTSTGGDADEGDEPEEEVEGEMDTMLDFLDRLHI